MTTEILTCEYKSEEALYLAYMPFVSGCGLFIRTEKSYELGKSVVLSIKLPNEPDYVEIDAKVIWITPKGAQGSKPAGIGVQLLGEKSRNFCNKIETCLAGMLKSSRPTDTL